MNRILRPLFAVILISLGLSYTAAQHRWTGGDPADPTRWSRAANWDGGVPVTGNTVDIPGGRSSYPVLDNDYTIGAAGGITIGAGAALRTNGKALTGGTVTNGGTLIFNGEESDFGTTLPDRGLSGRGEIHLINEDSTSTAALNLRISGTLRSTFLKIDVPSGRRVNLNGRIDALGDFELKGGILTGDAGEVFEVKGFSRLEGNIDSAANVRLGREVTLVSDVTLTFTGSAFPTFRGNIASAAAAPFIARSLTINSVDSVPIFGDTYYVAVGSAERPIETLKVSISRHAGSTVNLGGRGDNHIRKVDFKTVGDHVVIESALALEVTGNAGTTDTAAGRSGFIRLISGGGITLSTPMSSGGGNIQLRANGGGITISDQVNAGSGEVDLEASGDVTQTAGIIANGLILESTGTGRVEYNLNNESNDVDILAADTNGRITYHDADSVTVGILGAVSGIDTNGGDLTIEAAGTISQSAAGSVVANVTNLTAGDGTASRAITLANIGNDFGSVIFEGANVFLTDSNALILGGGTKTSRADGTLGVVTAGDISDGGAIEVTGVTTLNAGNSGSVILDNPAHDFRAAGGVTVRNAVNVTLADKNDIQLNDITMTGDLKVTVPLDPASSTPVMPRMYNINQTGNLKTPSRTSGITGSVSFKGRWNLTGNDLEAESIIALPPSAAAPGEKGSLIAAGTEEITVSEDFRPDTFTAADSTVVFTGGSPSEVGRIGAMPAAAPYTFNNIQIDKNAGVTVTAGNNWTVQGSLTLSRGNWILGNNSHTVHGNWDSRPSPFQFTSDGSTVTFVQGNTSITTRGTAAPGQSFNNIVVNKSTGKLTLNSGIRIDGNLTIDAGSGAISTGTAGTHDIVISGDWINESTASAFEPGDDTVIFDNSAPATAPKKLTTGGSAFNNLTVRGSSRVNTKDALTVNGNLVFDKAAGSGSAAPVLDMEGNTLRVTGSYNALVSAADDELGRLRLRGGARVSLPSPPVEKRTLGIVEYYGTGNASIGNIIRGGTGTAEYWHLVISEGTTAELSEDILVLGRSGAEKGILTEPLEANYDDDDDLMGLFIKSGSSLNLDGKTLTLYGSFQNRSGAASGFKHGRGTVNFVGSHPAFIYGRNTFFKFNINEKHGTDKYVGGKIVYFQRHSDAVTDDAPIPDNEPVTGIANHREAEINILGDAFGGPPTAAAPPERGVTLPNSSEWVYLVSSEKGKYWLFDKEPRAGISLKHVYIRNSDARIHPQSVPHNEQILNPDGTTSARRIVIVEDSRAWLRFIVVEKSVTEDSDANGRIDRILVTTDSPMKRKADGAYENLEITVKGYTIAKYEDGPGSTQFYIHLEEGNTLDTGAVPPWSIDADDSSIYAGAEQDLLKLKAGKEEETPEDGAPPIIGYALAVADSPRNEVFIRFSEPVTDNDGNWNNNFTFFTGPSPSNNVSVRPGGGTRLEEAVIKLEKPVTLEDIYKNREFSVSNVEDAAGNALRYDKHRVSDLALGITGNGIVQPTAATGHGGGRKVGAVVKFDGTDFLEADTIRIEAARRKPPGSDPMPDPKIVYDNSVSAAARANGLWLPEFNERNNPAPTRPRGGTFSGLVPRPWPHTKNEKMDPVSGSGRLFEYKWPADHGEIVNNTDLEFFFYLPSPASSPNHGNLYAARLIDDTASDWYRGVRPWSLLIRDIITQAGGITVLNNIINPLRGEKASLQYQVTDGGTVTIQVFDLSGDMVEILQRGYQEPGEYSVSWNGRNRGGGVAARGIYFIRYVGPGGIDQIRKVLVVK